MLRATRLLPLLALLPAPVFAQATGFSTATFGNGTANAQLNKADCESNKSYVVDFTLNQIPTSDQRVNVWVSDTSDCPSDNRTSIETVTPNASDGSGTTTVTASNLVADCSPVEDQTMYVCLELTGTALTTSVTTTLTVSIDTQPPAPPDTVSAVGGDQNVTVSWSYTDVTTPGDLASFRLGYREATSMADPTYSDTVYSVSPGKLTGLTNGVDYEVFVKAVDSFGNEGDASPSALATPVPSNDFWESYLAAGGQQQGGCTTGRGLAGPGLVLVLFAFFLGARRRRGLGRAALLVLAVAAFLPGTAKAQPWVDPQRAWFTELYVGQYRPSVDQEFGGSGPYQEIFGSGRPLLAGFRVERALWQGIGQLNLGIGASFGQAVGKSLLETGGKSTDTTVFNWIPIDLSASYVLDYAALHWGIPLALFGRAGIVYEPWWVLDGNGNVAVGPNGDRGQGARWGYRYSGGLMFLLDVLDPGLASDFRRSSGVDHTYIYFEYGRMQVDGFGSAGFDLSDTDWTAGLSVQF